MELSDSERVLAFPYLLELRIKRRVIQIAIVQSAGCHVAMHTYLES
jgi:hypothetical protein